MDNSVQGRLDRIERNEQLILENEKLILRYLGAILRRENLELVGIGQIEGELDQIEGAIAPRTFPQTSGIVVTRMA